MNIAKMMKQAKQMQEQMKTTQDALAQKEVEASVGGGAIQIVMTCDLKVKSLSIKPDVCDPKDVEMLEDLVLSALNSALDSAQKVASDEMGKVTGGMNLPGF